MDLLVSFVRWPAAFLWVCFVGPWIARLFGIPVRAAFWKMSRQNQQLTRFQFVWAFGVLVFGVGLFIFNLDLDDIQRVILEKHWSAKLIDLGFEFALSVFMGIVIAFWCAPTQIGESPITELDISQRH
jgi:hypothetical protein